jgi:hypothetical protein
MYFVAADLVRWISSNQKSPYSKAAAFYLYFCITFTLYNSFQNLATGHILGKIVDKSGDFWEKYGNYPEKDLLAP